MEKEPKKKNRNKKRKAKPAESIMDKKTKDSMISKTRPPSSQNLFTLKRISLHSSNYIPVKIPELDDLIKSQNFSHQNADNYFEITSKERKELKKIDEGIDEQYENKDMIFEILEEIENCINVEKMNCGKRINEIYEEELGMQILNGDINVLKEDLEKSEMKKNIQKKLYENSKNTKNQIFETNKEIERVKVNLDEQINQNKELDKKIPDIKDKITKIEEEINQQQNIVKELTENKNELRENYTKINQTAINDNKFCHDNFFALLTLFPYYKNVAFISTKCNIEDGPNSKSNENLDENKIIIDEKIIDDVENDNFKKIKFLLKQKEESKININYKILKDRRTLQINPKEKYRFNKIFSIINNDYIAEPWDLAKYSSYKLSTINSYFNEFNMTAISNNYFILYFVPVLDKTCLKGELYTLFQQLKNNEYIDKNISIKISAITESNYINLQNINQENNIKTQLSTINSSGIHEIYGFLYEFTKSNRLNKKNIFRLYNFDYSYPQAIDMMTNISKYYAKKKRKKTGVYKKVIRQGVQQKAKKKPADKSVNSNNNTNNVRNNNFNNKGNLKNNPGNKKNNNVNKAVQFKKSVITNNNNNRTTSVNNTNNQNNKSFVASNKKDKKTDNNKKVLNVSSLDNKKNLKKSGSNNQSQKKFKNVQINSKNNNIKYVKFDDKPKSITPKKNNSANKELVVKKSNSIVFNDLKTIKPEHTLIIHDITSEFVNNAEFKKIAKACGILNNPDK